jgi:anaerobic selenocysteine-containing dehydrogenase
MALIVRRMREAKRDYTAGSIGFYTSGQLFAEENYTLNMIRMAGIGTLHIDGNTRLCTATAGAALKETFGSDGQPGTYEDVDVTDCFLLVGHDMAATATVLWARVLDRRRSSPPSRMIVIDPRRTATAAEADLHIQPRLGTNVAVLNGLLQQLIEQGYVDGTFVDAHTLGFDELAQTVASYTPERVAEIAHIPADRLRQAAGMIGRSKMLLSTCLQGVYQSNQGTAAAVQVNNVNLLLGRIGRPGCGIFQMNGQPTAQNSREVGSGGDMPGFRNFDNPRHLEEIAKLWNVDPATLPNWGPPTHALQIFDYVQAGSIRVLWIVGTNPAVSVPDLNRLRGPAQARCVRDRAGHLHERNRRDGGRGVAGGDVGREDRLFDQRR